MRVNRILDKSAAILLSALIMVGVLAGCGGGGGSGGGAGVTTGTITGTVRDTNGNLLTNFNVAAAGGGSVAISGSSFTITGVAVGTQNVTVTKAGFFDETRPPLVTAGGTVNVDIAMTSTNGDTPPPPPF